MSEIENAPEGDIEETPAKPRGRKPKEQVAAVGRIVHYVTAQGTIRPAIITKLGDEAVDLTVFNSQGAVPVTDVVFDGDQSEGTYHWPVIG